MYWQNPNNVVLGGRLTYDPAIREIKTSEGTSKVVDFSIANNLKSSGSPAGKPHYFKCEAWGKTAELISEFFRKGDPIIINGSLQWASWEDSKTGEKRETVRVRVESFYFPESSAKKTQQEAPASTQGSSPQQARPRPPAFPVVPNGVGGAPYSIRDDDDIPF